MPICESTTVANRQDSLFAQSCTTCPPQDKQAEERVVVVVVWRKSKRLLLKDREVGAGYKLLIYTLNLSRPIFRTGIIESQNLRTQGNKHNDQDQQFSKYGPGPLGDPETFSGHARSRSLPCTVQAPRVPIPYPQGIYLYDWYTAQDYKLRVGNTHIGITSHCLPHIWQTSWKSVSVSWMRN